MTVHGATTSPRRIARWLKKRSPGEKIHSHLDFHVGAIGNYCKKTRKTAELVALLRKLQINGNESSSRTPLPRRHDFDPHLVKQLVDEYKGGRSTYELARKHQLRRNTVRDVLRREGVDITPGTTSRLTAEQKEDVRSQRARGESPTALALAFGVSLSTIKRALASSN
ncbi:hypothetical protein ACFOYW_16360 [Gryllotalpicola reticulitermitis]|uniref:Helix-turn-helix domain-containing protein n=1 Tax=Gryllotalpicola reticulitermitis TaxID=1184153 RepID=A0ABV8QC87_9MICO